MVCINQDPGHVEIDNMAVYYDIITDEVLIVHVANSVEPKIDNNPQIDRIALTQAEIDQVLNNFPAECLTKVTNQDINNVGILRVCDNLDGTNILDYYINNGVLAKRCILDVVCTATDTDGDGLPDIEGDGVSTCDFTCTIKDPDTQDVRTDISGEMRVDISRGKVLTGTNGIINFSNGVGNFTLRSVAETVKEVWVRVYVLDPADSNKKKSITLIAPAAKFFMNYR